MAQRATHRARREHADLQVEFEFDWNLIGHVILPFPPFLMSPFRKVYNIAQLKFSYMIREISALQQTLEQDSLALQMQVDAAFLKNPNASMLTAAYTANANRVVASFWSLADKLIEAFADGYCHGTSLILVFAFLHLLHTDMP